MRVRPAPGAFLAGIALTTVSLLAGCAPGTGAAATPSAAGTSPSATASVTAGSEPAGVLPLDVTRPVPAPDVTDADLATTLCADPGRGEPPETYTDQIRRIQLAIPVGQFGQITDPRDGRVYQVPGYRGYAGLQPGDKDRVELDHLLPVSAGGDGYDPANLWPQIGGRDDAPLAGADGQSANSDAKNELENYVHEQLCPAGGGAPRLSLGQAQALFATDWYAAYVALGRPGS